MAIYGEGIHIGTLVAGEDLSSTSGLAGQGTSGQFLGMKLSSAADRTALHCSTGNEATIGVLQNKPKLGEACDIQVNGETKMMFGGAITRGNLLELDSSGRAVNSTVAGHIVIGTAEESGASGEIHTVLLYGTPYAHP